MCGDNAVFKFEDDNLAGIALMPAPGQIPGDGVCADGIDIEGIAHHVKVVDAHVGEKHIGFRHIVAARVVCPIDIKRYVELRHVANMSGFEQAPRGAGQFIKAVVLRDHVFDTRFFARFNDAFGGFKIIAQGFFAQQVEARIKGFHRDGFVNSGWGDIYDKVGFY